MSYISMAGLTTALDHLLSLSESRLEAHSRRLAHRLVKGASAHGWTPFRSLDDASASPHIVALRHAKIGVERAMEALRRSRIVCGARNGRLRISLAPYNNSVDMDGLINVLAAI
jgi:selenocysteine lyase/cysteine desulfurase